MQNYPECKDLKKKLMDLKYSTEKGLYIYCKERAASRARQLFYFSAVG